MVDDCLSLEKRNPLADLSNMVNLPAYQEPHAHAKEDEQSIIIDRGLNKN